jgi:YVTN family beta-propeller protein
VAAAAVSCTAAGRGRSSRWTGGPAATVVTGTVGTGAVVSAAVGASVGGGVVEDTAEVPPFDPEHAASRPRSSTGARHRVIEDPMPGRTYCRVAGGPPRLAFGAVPGSRPRRAALTAVVAALAFLAACTSSGGTSTTSSAPATTASHTNSSAAGATTIPATSIATTGAAPGTTGAPGTAPLDATNVYGYAGANMFSPNVAGARPLVYVPSAVQGGKGYVDVIDQATMTVVDRYEAGSISQHVVPSWDLKTLYVTASAGNQLVPIDPRTGKPGTPIKATRPYNLYFTPDGKKAVVQNEQNNRLDYYNPVTWTLEKSVPSTCLGNNHADWSADGTYFIVTCEFSGDLIKVDTQTGEVLAIINLAPGAMPQDVRLTPDGKKFYVADMMSDGVWVVDGTTMTVMGRIATGVGAHGIYPSRDAKYMYVSNRGRHMGDEHRRSRPGEGSVSVVDPTTDQVVANWTIPDGGSPDMGGVSADGTRLWLSGRYDAEVYVFDTATGALVGRIPTDPSPHGLAVWPQPGRYSLGHTGNTR